MKAIKTCGKSTAHCPVSVLEAVVDVLNNRLRSNLALVSSNPKELLVTIKSLADTYYYAVTQLLNSLPSESERLIVLIRRRKTDIEEYYKQVDSTKQIVCTDRNTGDSVTNPDTPWNGWRHSATIDWLMDAAFHDVEGLKNAYASTGKSLMIQ